MECVFVLFCVCGVPSPMLSPSGSPLTYTHLLRSIARKTCRSGVSRRRRKADRHISEQRARVPGPRQGAVFARQLNETFHLVQNSFKFCKNMVVTKCKGQVGSKPATVLLDCRFWLWVPCRYLDENICQTDDSIAVDVGQTNIRAGARTPLPNHVKDVCQVDEAIIGDVSLLWEQVQVRWRQ